MNAPESKSLVARLSSTVHRLMLVLGQGLNYDFCPSYNKYVYWLKKPVGWVVSAALFSALVGFFIGPQGFVAMWSLLAFLTVGAIWPWLGMKGIQCKLHFELPNAEEDQKTIAKLLVTNRWPIPVFGLTVEGQFLQDIYQDDDKVAIGLQRIPGWSESEFTWEFKPPRRGILPQTSPDIATGFPFGIYQSRKSFNVDRPVIVWPKCESLDSVRGVDGANFNIEGAMSDRPGYDGDVIGARPYRRGDLLRHVNWAKTAKTNKLVVLERQTAAQKTIRIVVDLNPKNHLGAGSQSTYEWAIRIAATIGKHLHQHQSQIRLCCIGIPNTCELESNNQRGLTPILDYLATLPTMEDVVEIQGASPESICDDSIIENIRRDEEVFWIRSHLADSSFRIRLRSHICDIVLGRGPEGSNGNGHAIEQLKSVDSIYVDDWNTAYDQFQNQWERLCDA